MENTTPPITDNQELMNRIYDYAANRLVNQKLPPLQVKQELMDKGLDEVSAMMVINNLQTQLKDAKKEGAQKDMLWGAVWCIGGIILTVADIGFIFWGAILFGAIQFFKGVANS